MGGCLFGRESPDVEACRLGGGTQERALHAFFPARTRWLRMVCPQAGCRALPGGRDSVCHGSHVEAHGHYAAFRPAAAGLLAARTIRVGTAALGCPGRA